MEQHFLTNPIKLRALVLAAKIRPADRVLELGSGGGTVAAALPSCTLTLVELDESLAGALSVRFPSATVVSGDALSFLETSEAEVILSNLPHGLTPAVLEKLCRKTFRCAVVAVHEADVDVFQDSFDRLKLEPFITLGERDFTPPQPFRSQLLRVTRRKTHRKTHC